MTRPCFRVITLSLVLGACTLSSSFAAETLKNITATPKAAVKALKAAPITADKSAAKPVKKKFELPEADPVLVKLNAPAKSIKGLVSGHSNYGVAVEYASDPTTGGQEIWFNYSKSLKMHNFKQLPDLQDGDTVEVKYKEAADKRKLVTDLTLVAKKPAEPVAAPVAELPAKPVSLTAKETL